jgi:hypothetical protein
MNWSAVIEFLVRRVLKPEVYARLEATVLILMHAERRPKETAKEFNDRRRRMAIDEIKGVWPEVRTALLDIALGAIVYRVTPR